MTKTSGVLVVGHPKPKLIDFGAEVASNFQDAKVHIEGRHPSVLVFGKDEHQDFEDFCKWLKENSPETIWILSTQSLSSAEIIKWNSLGPLLDLIDDMMDPTLEGKVQKAFEAAGENVQKQKLVELFEDQSLQLKRLSTELESRVAKRQRALRRSRRTLDQTKTRLEAFHNALLGIHRAASIAQMETSLSDVLAEPLGLEWIKVRFQNQSTLGSKPLNHILQVEISFANKTLHGEIFFAKPQGQRFKSDEVEFLQELSDAIGLALSRLHTVHQAEVVKAQWQATFDAIPHPLCITSREFEILKLNKAFQVTAGSTSFRELIGKNCFHALLGPDHKAPKKANGPLNFRATRAGTDETEHFEVSSQSLGLTHDSQSVQLVLLRDITEDVRNERRILESSKMAELGTIGSSIAHELNNPLGGMLSFLQLILMDLKKDQTPYDEIKQMESAVLRCRDIVLNLLSFARKQDFGEFTQLNLWDVVEHSVKLIELQSKSKGIVIDSKRETPAMIDGSQNALTQVLCNLLQNSIDSISEKINENPLYPGNITIRINQSEGVYQLRLSDNGMGIHPDLQSQIFNPRFTTRDPRTYAGMGLTIAFTIITEHHGSLEILSQAGAGTTAILTFPTPIDPSIGR